MTEVTGKVFIKQAQPDEAWWYRLDGRTNWFVFHKAITTQEQAVAMAKQAGAKEVEVVPWSQ